MKILNKVLGILLTVIIIASSFVPQPVYALTQDRAIQGEGAQTDGTYTGAPATWANLNSDDAFTTTLGDHAKAGWLYHCYDMVDFATSYSSLNGVTLTYKVQSQFDTSTAIQGYVRIAGVNYYGTYHDAIPIGSWQTYTDNTFGGVTNKNPATGLNWTTATINAAEWGIIFTDYVPHGGSDDPNITYLKITIDYTPLTLPTITTDAATGVGYVAPNHIATLNGSITNTGGDTPDYYGFAYGTTANATVPASTEAPNNGTYGLSWISALGAYGVGSYNHALTGLIICSTYYFRFAAHNSVGWAWGSALSFVTLCNPDITTQAATYVGATTARLNALVIDAGGQLADVRFCYGTVSGNCTDGADCTAGTCNCTSYNTTTAWVENTYATGNTPYLDLSGLTTSTTYYFCAQIRNDVSCRCGGQLSFTTASGVTAPTNFKGIASSTSLSLFWIKGTGTNRTLIRYKLNTYPANTADGTLAYFDTMTSVTVSSLPMGTTYYFMAWGESGGTYTTSNATLILTTLSTGPTPGTMQAPTTPTNWFTAPDYTNVSNLPWYGMVNWWADSFLIPRSTLWFLLALFWALMMGIITYWKGGQKILIAGFVVLLFVGVACAMKLAPYWLLVPIIIIDFATIALGERI